MRGLLLALACVVLIACCPKAEIVEPKPQPIVWKSTEVKAAALQLMIIESVREQYPKVTASIEWKFCDERNSYYWPRSFKQWYPTHNLIQLCIDIADKPALAVFFAAHEMAHAVTDVYTFTWNEIDADELATLFLLQRDLKEPIKAAVDHWRSKAGNKRADDDAHPSAKYRAWFVECLSAGSKPQGSAQCQELYRATVLKWNTRLSE